MAQLESEQLLDEQLLGKETGKPIDLPELQSALSNDSLQSDELVAAYSRDSLQHHSLQQKELCTNSFLRTDQLPEERA